MAKILRKSASLLRGILDIILPPVCYACGNRCSGKYGLCEVCLDKIVCIPPPHCPKCGRRLANGEHICRECTGKPSHIERGWSCCYYDGTIKDLIHLFKYNRYLGLIDIFKDVMADFVKKNKIEKHIDLIVPVPVHPAKQRERSYNHAQVLASSLSDIFSIPMDCKNLKKIKWTQSQSELDKEKRLKNVKDSFFVIEKQVFSERNVLIVDDVYTTGATINECAKALLDAGSGKVYSLALARGF